MFKQNNLKFLVRALNPICNCCNPFGIKMLKRLRISLSHLRQHKFKHCFHDSLSHFTIKEIVKLNLAPNTPCTVPIFLIKNQTS